MAANNYGEIECPACGGETEIRRVQKTRVDVCRTCKGAWFAGRELQQVLGEQMPRLEEKSKGRRICPECNVHMRVVTVEQPAVVVDQCDACAGIWLDKGEFRKLKAAGQFEKDCSVVQPGSLKEKLLQFIDRSFTKLADWE